MTTRFTQTTTINVPREEAFAWHQRPGGFERLAPPWEELRVVDHPGGLEDGKELVFKVQLAPAVWKTWRARHYGFVQDEQFCDEQIEGPFALWKHVHRIEKVDDNSCRLIDDVEYELPLKPISSIAAGSMTHHKIEALFAYRCATVKADLERHAAADLPPQRVALTGSSGFIGSSLIPFLEGGGHEVTRLVRRPAGDRKNLVFWDTESGVPPEELEKLEGHDAVVHLAGESILGLWTDKKKARIRRSRLVGTRRLCEALAKLEKKPRVLVAASAVGFYGDRGDEELTEESSRGNGFLAEVGEEWEKAADAAREAGIRVVHLRIGVVLGSRGGALKSMRTPFSLGLGGRLGSGKQYMSWIGIDDLIYVIHRAIVDEGLSGPVNATAPFPVTNAEFTRTLARVLSRPVGPPMPEAILRTVAGDMAEEGLLASVRATPKRLMDAGYQFAHRDLEVTLRHQLGKAITR